jgi:DNA-binding NarL/FixJ family response regulator
MSPIRILLVDDNPEFLDVAAYFLSTEPQLEIVGRALSGHEALSKISQLQPDLVFLDLAMPNMNGLEVTRKLKGQSDLPRIIILTLHDSQEYRNLAEAMGADGFITKSDFGTELLPLIHTLFNNSGGGLQQKVYG